MYPTKVLVAVDGSEASDLAMRHAVDLCEKTGSELNIVMVGLVSIWTHPDTLSSTQYKRLKREMQTRVDKEVEKAKTAGAQNPIGHLRMGRVDTEVIRLAEQMNIGLIVVGSRGMESLERILLGNDSESIIRHAPCPVLVVR